jgi:hypothetical protein
MEYRGIRYTLRAGIERGKWFVAIYPEGVEIAGKIAFGTREDAESHAHHMIDRWVEPKSRQRSTPTTKNGGALHRAEEEPSDD